MLETTQDLIEQLNTSGLRSEFINVVPLMVSRFLPIVGAIAIGFFALYVLRKILNV